MEEQIGARFSDFVFINPPTSLKKDGTYSFIEMKDLNERYRYVYPSGMKKLSGGARFRNGDTLFARITPCLENGKISQAKGLLNDVGFGSTEFLIFRGRPSVSDPDFVYYLSRTDEVRRFAELNMVGTSGRQRVPKEIFDNLFLDLPPLPLQHRIAEILGALDDKIELNRQMNHTIEQMAQALYKHYFVDDIDPENLPEGWRNGVLGEIFNITMGQSPDGKSYNTDKSGILFFQGRTDFGFRFPEARVYTSEPKRYAKKFDTLVSVRAPVGDINIAYDDCCVGRGLAAVQHKTIKPSFTFYTLKSLRNDFNTFNGEGTVFGSINKDDFNRISITIPLDSTLNAFEGIVKPLDDLIFTNHNEILNLALIRDFLLPRLIIGEITPSDLQTIEPAL